MGMAEWLHGCTIATAPYAGLLSIKIYTHKKSGYFLLE